MLNHAVPLLTVPLSIAIGIGNYLSVRIDKKVHGNTAYAVLPGNFGLMVEQIGESQILPADIALHLS